MIEAKDTGDANYAEATKTTPAAQQWKTTTTAKRKSKIRNDMRRKLNVSRKKKAAILQEKRDGKKKINEKTQTNGERVRVDGGWYGRKPVKFLLL